MVLYIVALSKRKSTNSLFMLVDVEKHEVGIYRKGFRGSRMSELGSLTRLNNFKTSTLNILYFILQSSNFNSFAFLFYFVLGSFQPITAKDDFSFSVETVLPSHGFPPMGVYHVGLFDGLLPFVNVACGAREVKPSCDFLEKYQV